jgi:hypothetical protein
MAQRFNDGTSGDVVIRSGPPAAGGGGGSGGGGGFGGNRVGASGAFSGPSQKTKDARRRVKQEYLQAQEQLRIQAAAAAVQAQEQARLQTRQQALAAWAERHNSFRATVDQGFQVKTAQLASSLEQDISAARRPPDNSSSERWQLYTITKAINEIDGLIAQLATQLSARNTVANSFDGLDPLTRSTNDYLARLDQFGDALAGGHQLWESAYNAAHEARLLSAKINALTEKSTGLSRHHAEQTVVWRELEANWERQRQVAEQREARIRFKQQADESSRLERVKQANTLSLPVPSSLSAASMLFNSRGLWVAGAADELALAMARAAAGLGAVASASGTLTAPQLAIFIGGMTYPSELGNGELTPEQRARLFHAVAVPAQALDLYDSQELQTIADAGGSVESGRRLKVLAGPEGNTAVIVTDTGGEVDPGVPVVNALLDPLTGQYTAEIPGSPKRYVHFTPGDASTATVPDQTRLTVSEPQFQDMPVGVDWRIQDCIVCVPGLEPIYLSFQVAPMGTGIVTGTGQPATADWWKPATQPAGAAIPAQVGDQFRGREFTSFESFNEALWQTLAEDRALASSFNELNEKRIEQGFAPIAPKSTWVGENREFELRYLERSEFWGDAFNLDKISIKTPNSAGGWLGVVPAVTPWPIPPASSWKPLVPPGTEHLGSTTSPITPTEPSVYPGNPVIPVLPTNETFPAVDEGEIGAIIPGYPGDEDLPSPGLVFAGPPVEPLEVGPYNELSGRSRGDGLDIDHIPSRRALEAYMELKLPEANKRERADILQRTPSIAIPAEVHRRFSETYGGRNHLSKQLNDAADLQFAVDKNFDAIKAGLLEHGFGEKDIEVARLKLHELHIEQGWY